MKLSMQAGKTSQSINVFIQDSSSTTGAGLTGLAFNSAGLTAYYALPKAAAVQITLATLAAITTAYSSGGFKEVDATNMPGWYRLDLPDAAIASGRYSTVHLKGATNMAPLPLEIELTAWDNQDVVRGGLTALPNAAAGANGGLPLGDASGRVDIGKLLGTAWLTPGTAGTPDVNAKLLGATVQTGRDIGASVLLSAGSGAGQLDFTSGVVKANLAQILGTALTETAGLLAGGFKKFFNVASPTLTCLGIDQTGDGYARLGAPAGASHAADVAAVKVDTAAIKVQTDKFVFSVANQVDSNVLDWKSSTAPAMTGDAFARLGAPAGASIAADLATIASYIDTEVAAILAAVDTEVAAILAKTNNLPGGIQKNTALSAFEFYMVDSSDHVTGKTGLTPTCQRSINGGAFGACANAPAEIGSGFYKIDLAAADLNGDTIGLKFTSAGADQTSFTIKTNP